MDVAELERRLIELRVRPDAYSLTGGRPSEAYVLARDADGYRTYYSERGQEVGVRRFPDEHAACTAFLEEILEVPHIRDPEDQDPED